MFLVPVRKEYNLAICACLMQIPANNGEELHLFLIKDKRNLDEVPYKLFLI